VRNIIVSSPSAVDGDGVEKNKPSVAVEKIEKTSDATVIKLVFAQDAYLINKAEEAGVLRQLSSVLQTAGKKIVIWTASQPDDALLVRGNMTRLLSVRNMLLRHGISGDLIEVRIVPQAPMSKTTGHVFIEINKEDGYVENK
jgi:hypothetical protein